MKYLFQLIGLAMVLLILLGSVLFYMESMGLLEGEFAMFIREMRELWLQAKTSILAFLQQSGIAGDAADLLDQGADMLRGTETPYPADTPAQPGILITSTPQPSAAPTQIVLPALTPQPTATPQMVIINTPAP